MKRLFLLCCAAVGLLASTSCEKCRTCTYEISFGTSTTSNSEDNCAKKKDLDSWEAERKKAIEAQVQSGGTLQWNCADE